jgi:uncharacterized repeat protein (TIGR01451 family)
MRKCYLLIFLLFGSIYYCHAQGRAPGLKWQKDLGGSSVDGFGNCLVDRDGQIIAAGYAMSFNGDVTGNHGATDIWVVKLDAQNNILWNVSLGGPGSDGMFSIQLAHDSGYIIAGYATVNGGNVSGNHGSDDVWIVRLGNKGNVVWQKCLGGSKLDRATYIAPTTDGYILTGVTYSTDGDVKGKHGTDDTYDSWVVKLDKNGNIMWQKCLGGFDVEVPSVIKQTADGGYILAGTTRSKNDGDVQGWHGDDDMWIVKLTSDGAIEWQKCLGGTRWESAHDIVQTATGGYLIAGSTASDNGDVTGYHLGYHPFPGSSDVPTTDAWVISLSATGNLEWQKCLGGIDDDDIYALQLQPDKTVLALGETFSLDANGATPGCWLFNFNSSNGNINWETSFGTAHVDHGSSLAVKNDGNLIIAGNTTQNVSRSYNAWLFEAGASNVIAGRVFYDANSDGIQNNGESAYDKVMIKSGKNGDTLSAIPLNGYYGIDVDTGTYSTKVVPYNNYYNIVPASQTSTFNSYFNTDSIHFAVQPVPGILDASIGLVPLTPARPGFTTQYKIVYKNVGTTPIANGTITLVKDQHLTLNSALPVAATTNGNTISWNYSNLDPNKEASITLNFVISAPPAVNLGDTVKSKAWITVSGTDVTPNDDTAILKQVVTGSFDPNDKTEANAGVITPDQVSNGEYLNYTIRFQNMGTDTAFKITVRDTLESRLDWSSLQMVAASHAYQLSIEDGNKLTWQFDNIKLPYSGIDEPNSHGYIAYRIRPKPTVMAGQTIINTAGIYFDYNLPVATNAAKTLVMVLSPLPVTLTSFKAALNGDVVNVTWKTSLEENIKQFEVERSANGVDFITIGTVRPGQTSYLFTDQQPLTGFNYYRLKMVDIDGAYKHSPVVLVNVKNEASIISSLYPNPGNGNIQLKLQGVIEGNVLVQVIDLQGRPLVTRQYGVQHTGEFKTPIVLSGLSKGTYVLRITVNDKTYLHKLLIQ